MLLGGRRSTAAGSMPFGIGALARAGTTAISRTARPCHRTRRRSVASFPLGVCGSVSGSAADGEAAQHDEEDLPDYDSQDGVGGWA